MLRVALNAWKESRGRSKFDCRNFSSKGKIEPGFDFGRPMFGPHYGITNAPIQPDGTPLWVNWTNVRGAAGGAIGPAVDHGFFGTCYICATLTGMQGVNFLATYDSTRQSVPLSMQHVFDCGTLTDGDMYNGGRPEDLLNFAIKNGGILAESVYPFKGKVGPCKFKQANRAMPTADASGTNVPASSSGTNVHHAAPGNAPPNASRSATGNAGRTAPPIAPRSTARNAPGNASSSAPGNAGRSAPGNAGRSAPGNARGLSGYFYAGANAGSGRDASEPPLQGN